MSKVPEEKEKATCSYVGTEGSSRQRQVQGPEAGGVEGQQGGQRPGAVRKGEGGEGEQQQQVPSGRVCMVGG